MITRACGFVQFDTEEDFSSHVFDWGGLLRFEGDSINRPNRFPAVYKYHEPWDAHFCGNWVLCEDSTEMLTAMADRVKDLLKMWEKVAEPIDSKQHP